MKKFLCATCLLLISMAVMATAQMKAYSPPEQDIGYKQVAALSVDGMTVVSFDQQWNIVGWQTPVMLQEVSSASAQVVDAYTVSTCDGHQVSMTLVAYLWPRCKSECTNHRNDYNYVNDYPPNADAYSFTASRTDFTL